MKKDVIIACDFNSKEQLFNFLDKSNNKEFIFSLSSLTHTVTSLRNYIIS